VLIESLYHIRARIRTLDESNCSLGIIMGTVAFAHPVRYGCPYSNFNCLDTIHAKKTEPTVKVIPPHHRIEVGARVEVAILL